MNIVYIIGFFILGLVFGSFFQVVALRLVKGESILRPKYSYCPSCHHRLGASELIPVFSYLFQKGRCKHCKQKISLMYPFVELLTGLLFAVSFYSFGFTLDLLLVLILCSYFVIVLVTDLSYMIIPDEVTITVSILLVILQFVRLGFWGGFIQLASGIGLFILMYLLMLLGNRLFHQESLGGGDIKLMFVVGVAVHPVLAICVIFLGSCIALPISLIFYFMKSENVIPFGPFLLVGLLFLIFLKVDFNSFLDFLRYLS